MSWASGGVDRKGRPIGYAVEATCDQPGCSAKIDRGMGYACGGEHWGAEIEVGDQTYITCGGYFCGAHGGGNFCAACLDELVRLEDE